MPKQQYELINVVAEMRSGAGLTQTELAALVGVSRQTIGAIEKGDYSPSTVLALRLAVVLRSRVDDLFALPQAEQDRLRCQVV